MVNVNSNMAYTPIYSQQNLQSTPSLEKFNLIEQYVEKYVQISFATREKKYTTIDCSPTQLSVGEKLTHEAIQLASKEFKISPLEIACWLDSSEAFFVHNLEGDWWTFPGFASKYEK